MSISNIPNNNSITKILIEKNTNLSTEEKNQLINLFDAVDEQEEDNQPGIITTEQAINSFWAKTKNYLGEKYNEFLNFYINNNSNEPQVSPQSQHTRAKQYEILASSLNIEYETEKIDKQKTKQILNSGYVDAHGNVTDTPDNIQTEGRYIMSEKDLANMKYVFGQTQFADNFEDHNQMLDAMEYAKKKGVDISEATVLINCDTHSDVYINCPGKESIADWVNSAIAKNPNITDFYWVVSENMIEDKEFGNLLSGNQIENSFDDEAGAPLYQNVGVKADLKNSESVQTYYISPDGFLYDDNIYGDGRPIRIHITTEKNLPDFSGKKVISTFDMDFFSNSGVDTKTLYRDNKNEEELNQAFSQMLQTFADHHIQPIMHGNCYSNDDYLPKEDYNQVQGFANEIIKSTPQGLDVLDQYKHKHK